MTLIEKTNNNESMMNDAHRDFQSGLNKHAFYRVNDHEIGQNLVQDTFLKTWNYIRKGGTIIVMKSFLYHILNNLIIDEYRRHKATSLDTLLESGYEPSTDDHIRLIDTLDGKTASMLIDRLLEKYRKVLRMRYEQHLSLTEMSTLTGQTRNTMAVQVHRGLKQLKALYDNPYAIV
ncbi:MAG: RNA polymerase sigma factor [Candidatus Taylorbacteria bacterium]|nr:RNA polymerase sigma factor [Candidatus Taylorbacteria bacterium]